jgi:hypothetical protein
MNLEEIKETIERFPKKHQIEVLKIIKQHSNVTINENKSGIYINLTFLSEDAIQMLRKYIDYVKDQENILTPFESQKQTFKNTFFMENNIET